MSKNKINIYIKQIGSNNLVRLNMQKHAFIMTCILDNWELIGEIFIYFKDNKEFSKVIFYVNNFYFDKILNELIIGKEKNNKKFELIETPDIVYNGDKLLCCFRNIESETYKHKKLFFDAFLNKKMDRDDFFKNMPKWEKYINVNA